MVTTKITIEAHLAEYCWSKFSADPDGAPVKFPDNLDIYHLIYDLLEKRPINSSRDQGNLEIILPDRREGDLAGGKSPERFNYLGIRSQKILNKKIKLMMRAELHDLIDENKHKFGIDQIQSVHYFMKKYCIESITEEALQKDYQRWRDNIRRSSKNVHTRKNRSFFHLRSVS